MATPSMRRRAIIPLVLAPLALAAHLSVGPSQAAPAAEACSLPEHVLTRADLPAGVSVVACAAIGRRLSLGQGVGVVVPPPGEGVTVSALGVDEESSVVMSVDVTPEGEIVYGAPAEGLGAASTDPSPAACDDPAHGQLGFKWDGPIQWWLNTGKRPANLTATQTLQAIRDGGTNITDAANDCGQVDDVSAAMSYQGTTTAGADMFNSDGIVYCDVSSLTNDLSTVQFAWMPAGYLGATCTWRVNRDPEPAQATESDMRLNINKEWTVAPGWSGCDQQYDLEYVTTHERGHSFGLADLTGDHTGLTMYGRGTACSKAGRTLGLGDIQGLRLNY